MMRLLLILLCLCVTSGMGYADVPVHKTSTQVPGTLETELNSLSPATNQPFAFRLADTVTAEGQRLAKGTELKGNIIIDKPSKRFDRPAYIMVQVTEIDPPDAPPIPISRDLQPKTRLKFQPGTDRTLQHFIVENVLLENASLLVSVPFAMVSSDSSPATFTLVDTAASVAIGALYGLKEKPKLMVLNPDLTVQKIKPANRTFYVVHAVYESVSPIPPVWELFSKPKEFDYKAGTILSVPMKTEFLKTVLQLCSTEKDTSHSEILVNYTK